MTNTVDLIVIGVEEETPRAEMSSRLVKAFKQEAYTFEALLDGAYGESAPYAAQTDVEQSLAQGGKEQLEKLGLVCTILPTGEKPEPVMVPAAAKIEAEEIAVLDEAAALDFDEADPALATFKAEEGTPAAATDEASDISFDLDDEIIDSDTALASFKKDEKKDKNAADVVVDFADDIASVGGDTAAVGLADAKKAKNDVSELDDALTTDFSDQIEEVGADQIAKGLKEAQKAKPDFAADVGEVDFSDDVMAIGIHEEDPSTPEIKKSKLEEEATERNLNSFPKEQTEETIDFSDELNLLAADALPVSSKADGPINKGDVPEALAEGVVDELDAELIDPAPAEKEQKAPVEIDDGGLTLSDDNDTPLTAPKEKLNTEPADDGGLVLSADSSAPLTTPAEKADQAAADDAIEQPDSNIDADDAKAVASLSDNKEPSSDVQSADVSPIVGVSDEDTVSQPVSEVHEPAPEQLATEQPAKVAKPEAPAAVAAQNVPDVQAAPDPDRASPTQALEPKPLEPTALEPTPSDPTASAAQAIADEAVSAAPSVASDNKAAQGATGAASGGLVLPGQLSRSVVPNIISEDDLDDVSSTATASLHETMPASREFSAEADAVQPESADIVNDAINKAQKEPSKKKNKKKIVAAIAGIAALAGAGTFAFLNAGSISPMSASLSTDSMDLSEVKDANSVVEKMRFDVARLKPDADLENLSTGQLLVNLSNNQSNGIVDLEPYFLESGDQVKRGPRLGAAIPAESEWMIRNRQSHPADAYFDSWSNRDADLSLFLALLDNLIEKGDLEVAQQLSDRAKDKLFAVMSTQRLARAYSDVGEKNKVTRLMAVATRDTYSIKAPEERVLALSDYAFTEQAIGLNEGAKDTFLKTSILARSLVKPERRAVGLSSAAMYFHRSGRTEQAQDLLEQALLAGKELPKNTAARDLAVRYIALSESRMGLFNQALEHTKLIVDPIATVSAYHGIALAIESSGDNTSARKVLNMAYRAGSQIEDADERSSLLSKVVLASETEK